MSNKDISFIDLEAWENWGQIDVHPHPAHGWSAKAVVEATNPDDKSTPGWLIFTADGDSPEEALARVERGIIETLAVGGQLEERRHLLGRRAYDEHDRPEYNDLGRRSSDRRITFYGPNQ